jgi:aryl-alcohol dehydrogenase-like predicted oxidoreductase
MEMSMMEYRKLPSDLPPISEISFGCMSLEQDQKLANKLIHKACDFGVNYFDTADIYQAGINEALVGAALQGKREEIILATKVGNQLNPNGEGWRWNPSKSYILEAVEMSLKRLKTDYIDIYQLHGGTIDDPIEEVMEAFEILKEQGKILHYGISSIRPNVISKYTERSDIVSVMLQYNILDRRPEEKVLSQLNKKGIGVFARGVLAKGITVKTDSTDYLDYGCKYIDLLKDKINVFSIEERSNIQTILCWVLHNEMVTSAVVGVRNLEQLDEVLGTMNSPLLNEETYQQLNNVLVPNRYIKHRD